MTLGRVLPLHAIVDALRPLGVDHVDMPVAPFRVWDGPRARSAGAFRA